MNAKEIAEKYFPDNKKSRDELEADIKRFDNAHFTDQEEMVKALAGNRTLLEKICMKAYINLDHWVYHELEQFCLFKVEKDELPIKRTAAFAGLERWINNAIKYQKRPTNNIQQQQQSRGFVV